MTGAAVKLGHVLVALLRAIDILACVVWLSALYPFGLADKPTGYETISAYVGRAQHNGMAWARPAAAVIDFGARLLGERPGHCIRAYLFWAVLQR